MQARLTRSVAALLAGALVAGTGIRAQAQIITNPGQGVPLQQLPPPPGSGWRPITPQPLGQQQFNLQAQMLLRSGDIIPVSFRSTSQPIYVAPGETRPFSLTLDSALRDPRGNVVVPAGATIEGQFQPSSGGTQFVARSITINNQSYPLFAQSATINNQRDPRQTSGEAIAQDALIGAAAGALLGGLFGDRVISTEKVLGGAAAGAVIGNVTAPEVAVIAPNSQLTLTVTQDFQPFLRQ